MPLPTIYRRSQFPVGQNAPRQDVACYELVDGERDPLNGTVRRPRVVNNRDIRLYKARLRNIEIDVRVQESLNDSLRRSERSSLGQPVSLIRLA